MTSLLERLPMIPRLTATGGLADCLAHAYAGWELLEVDDGSDEILICKPCEATWAYTRSKHLLILYGEVAVIWQGHLVEFIRDMNVIHKHGLLETLAEIRDSIMPYVMGR